VALGVGVGVMVGVAEGVGVVLGVGVGEGVQVGVGVAVAVKVGVAVGVDVAVPSIGGWLVMGVTLKANNTTRPMIRVRAAKLAPVVATRSSDICFQSPLS